MSPVWCVSDLSGLDPLTKNSKISAKLIDAGRCLATVRHGAAGAEATPAAELCSLREAPRQESAASRFQEGRAPQERRSPEAGPACQRAPREALTAARALACARDPARSHGRR